MSDSVKKFFKAVKDVKSQKAPQNQDLVSLMMNALNAIAGAMSVAQMQETNNLLRKIKNILLLKEVAAIKPAIGTLDQPEEKKGGGCPIANKRFEEQKQSREAMLFGLEKLTTSKMCSILKERIFLLYRPTVLFEYDKSKRSSEVQSPEPQEIKGTQGSDNTETYPDYETTKDTEWLTDSVVAENNRNKKNPIIAAWIPESGIKDVHGGRQGIGAWGDLGANADKDIVTITVKPGKYKLYSELRA